MRKTQKIWIRNIQALLQGLLCLSLLAACSRPPDKESNQPKSPDEKQKVDETNQKRAARQSHMLVEIKTAEVAYVNENSLGLRFVLSVNDKIVPLAFTAKMATGDSDLQDRSEDIRGLFPKHNLQILVTRFQSGKTDSKLDLLGIEYRLSQVTATTPVFSSQFALIVLQKSLGNNAVIKSSFEFPTQSDLDTWIRKVTFEALGTGSTVEIQNKVGAQE